MKKGVVLGALVGLLVLAVYTASAHMGYGMMPAMWHGAYPVADEDEAPEVKVTEVTGKVLTVYPMAIVLEDGKYIQMPWWFAANLGIKPGDEVKVKGFSYGNVIVPTFVEANGKTVGEDNARTPVWVQEYAPAYGYGFHCPMMGW